MEIAIEKAEKYGSGSVAVHNSRHIGMLAYHSMMPLEHDMIGLTMTAGNSHLALFQRMEQKKDLLQIHGHTLFLLIKNLLLFLILLLLKLQEINWD